MQSQGEANSPEATTLRTRHFASVELSQGVTDAMCHQAAPLGVGVQAIWHQLDRHLFVAWAVETKDSELDNFGGGHLEHLRL